MHVLGINAYHGGASACILRDGQLLCAVEEERFNRQKYWAGFPTTSIQHCLSVAGIDAREVDHVAMSRDPGANFLRKAVWALRRNPRLGYLTDRLINREKVKRFDQTFCDELGVARGDVRAQFHHVEHHRAHMASAFMVSPFENAAILSVDGMGDFVSTMWGTGKDNKMSVDDAIHFPHSLGFLYTAVSQWLGFTGFGDEGKVMGLASYGSPVYADELRNVIRIHSDGSFELDLDYFVHEKEGVEMTWAGGTPTLSLLFSPKFVQRFGEPRVPRSPVTKQHEDMAASLQAVLEDALAALLNKVHRETQNDTLCLAGGVALNGVFNGQIRARTPFRNVYIQPAASDSGTSLGAAFYVWNQLLGNPRSFEMNHAYTGPAFGESEIEAALKQANVQYRSLSDDDVVDRASSSIMEGKVVGWFQGAMEWGPRALGNRSILADPRRAEMRDTLNARIKHREPFRPFAPSLLETAVDQYFVDGAPDPFMVTVYPVKEAKRAEIPAVTHVDGTGRLQSVTPTTNERYHRLISAFGEKTGVPVVLNTSFNENEPIVCTPAEAIDCFSRTRMDSLFIGNFVVTRA
ncbi:MAG TPA: carbamoyltransferase C-terminal domain-containing protein [Longimicrobiales bacterium]|nr:carbamoyltransferase C-terminal domain-containing protein [Longimicrobiales bacterium]